MCVLVKASHKLAASMQQPENEARFYSTNWWMQSDLESINKVRVRPEGSF